MKFFRSPLSIVWLVWYAVLLLLAASIGADAITGHRVTIWLFWSAYALFVATGGYLAYKTYPRRDKHQPK